MLFTVDAQAAEIPTLLSRFVAITGIAPWQQREKDFSRHIAENRMIDQYLDIQFTLERAMIHARQYRANTGRLPSPVGSSVPGLGAAYAFGAMAARMFSRLPGSAQNSFRRKLLGALKDNIG
jgi:hypothetical protein